MKDITIRQSMKILNKIGEKCLLVVDEKKKAGIFPIDSEAWINVGQWTEYQQSVKRL